MKIKIVLIEKKKPNEKYPKMTDVIATVKLSEDGTKAKEVAGAYLLLYGEPKLDYVYDVEKTFMFNKKLHYKLKDPATSQFKGSSRQRTTYTLQEYDALFNHATEVIEKISKKVGQPFISSMVSTYIISAVNSGVKV